MNSIEHVSARNSDLGLICNGWSKHCGDHSAVFANIFQIYNSVFAFFRSHCFEVYLFYSCTYVIFSIA